MEINGKILCDNCFEEIAGEPCPICGFAHNGYQPDVGVLPVGTVLRERYHIGKVLGKGGFGVTYKAYDELMKMMVAVKEYYPNGLAHRDTGTTQVSVGDKTLAMDFQSGAEKFCDEAKTIARFNGNPNIVGVHDYFQENGTAYFIMEYLDGMDLKHYIKLQGGKLTQENVVHIAKVVSDALLITHSMNVLHRDISPDNIYITNDGQIKLIDFGAARQVMSQQSKSLSVILKQGFAPLEQYQRKGKQGAWTDIYALGATLYYALTGEVPDDATERLEDPDLGNPKDYGVDAELWAVINKCMAVKISDRYEETTELKKALNKLNIQEAELERPKEPERAPAAAPAAAEDDDRTVAMNVTPQPAPQPAPQSAASDMTVAMNVPPQPAPQPTLQSAASDMTVAMNVPPQPAPQPVVQPQPGAGKGNLVKDIILLRTESFNWIGIAMAAVGVPLSAMAELYDRRYGGNAMDFQGLITVLFVVTAIALLTKMETITALAAGINAVIILGELLINTKYGDPNVSFLLMVAAGVVAFVVSVIPVIKFIAGKAKTSGK